ncbi:MAG: helix-turn-helix transcriptional regulator [Ruminococcaceae bacterium]|nr:helix-turn-helix transcriptional regulator [Oscillospiraceae bacterium]
MSIGSNGQYPIDNICRFSAPDDIKTSTDSTVMRFVYENSAAKLLNDLLYPAFGCYLITSGSAVLVIEGAEHEIEMGDMFVTFPMIPISFREENNLKCMYINFVGSGMEEMLASVGIKRGAQVCKKMGELIDIWFYAINRSSAENLSMLGMGVLYYTLAMVPSCEPKTVKHNEENIAVRMKHSADMCYQNEDMSIDYLAKQYKYNSKYLSRKFISTFGIKFSDYLETTRINRAIVLLGEGDKSVQEIAALVGYHDPLYFSKVFKKHMKMSPSQYKINMK